MKVGDLVRLPAGTSRHWDLSSPIGLLVEKLPREDKLEYDWKVLVDGQCIEFGRQIEESSTLVSHA